MNGASGVAFKTRWFSGKLCSLHRLFFPFLHKFMDVNYEMIDVEMTPNVKTNKQVCSMFASSGLIELWLIRHMQFPPNHLSEEAGVFLWSLCPAEWPCLLQITLHYWGDQWSFYYSPPLVMLTLPEWGFMIMIQMEHLEESHLISCDVINTGTALFALFVL